MSTPIFNQISIKRNKSNVFDLSHEKKLSMNMGDLVPFYIQDVIPGDKFRCNTEMLMRLAPLISPVMHRINVYTHFFFVPSRLVYEDFQKFITGGVDGKQVVNYPMIKINEANRTYFRKGSLADYLGIPPYDDYSASVMVNEINISALPFRAYRLIYENYYQDQTLNNIEPTIIDGNNPSGGNLADLMSLRRRSWEHDYFTSCLPFPQRGNDVTVPFSFEEGTQLASYVNSAISPNAGLSGDLTAINGELIVDGTSAVLDNSSSQTINVNDLRRSVKLQEWLERAARGGSRYIEQIRSFFGVSSSDARLQRPEYLGGGKAPVIVSETLSTVETESTPQGNMAGHGISVGNSNSFSKYFEEHGYIIGIMSVLPRTAYQDGIERFWTKFDKFDYYWPPFANLGEQKILQKEIFPELWNAADVGTQPDDTFGYLPIYSEYKFKNSSVHGDFRDNLDFWHMGRKFSEPPVLNDDFVQSNPTFRIFAVEDQNVHHLYVQLYNNVKAVRQMPVFGTPLL